MQPPPPVLGGPMRMARKKMLVAVMTAAGLLFLMVGGTLVDVSGAARRPGEPADAVLNRADLANVWGPAIGHFGIFLFVLGLVAASLLIEDMDVFVRLFLLIVAFVALLLVLAGSTTIFG